jgi:hypothetical protein
MNIFIWKSYGVIAVYQAETDEDLAGLIDLIEAAVDGWGMGLDVGIARLRNVLETNPNAVCNEITQFCRNLNDTEAFEQCGFTSMIMP